MKRYFCIFLLSVCLLLSACAPAGESVEVTSGPVVQKDGWVYFTSFPPDYENSRDKRVALYRMKPDGKDLEELTRIDWLTSFLVFAGDCMYCLNGQYNTAYNPYLDFERIYKISDVNQAAKTKRKISLDLNIRHGHIAGTTQSEGNWIYYTDRQTPGFFRANIDGTQSTQISDLDVHRFWIHDDWVYFHHAFYSQSPERGFYRMRLDGTEAAKLSDDFPDTVVFMEDWIYFTGESRDKVYRMKTDGTGRSRLLDGFLYITYEVTPKRLYFEDLHTLYASNPDGSEQVALLEDVVGSFKVHGEWIYYVNILDHALHKIRLDGTGDTKLNDEKISSVPMEFFIVGEWIYYYRDADWRLCRMKLDGSQAGLIVQ